MRAQNLEKLAPWREHVMTDGLHVLESPIAQQDPELNLEVPLLALCRLDLCVHALLIVRMGLAPHPRARRQALPRVEPVYAVTFLGPMDNRQFSVQILQCPGTGVTQPVSFGEIGIATPQ